MKKNWRMNLNKLIFVILLISSSVFGQDVGTTEVKVVEGFKSVIPDAIRLNENASFLDTIRLDRTQSYEIVNVKLESDYKTKPLAVAKVKDAKITKLYATQIGAALGNAFTSKLDIVHNSKRSKTFSYGFFANHFANKYFEANSMSSNSENRIHFYAKKVSSHYVFLTSLDYDRITALHYDDSLDLEQDGFFRNRFAYSRFSLSLMSKDIAEDKLKHHTTFFISDLNEFSENQIHLSSTFSKKIYESVYSLEFEFNDYLRYNNSDAKFINTELNVFSLAPQMRFMKYDIDFKLALDVNVISDGNQIGFFPRIKATKELVRDVLLLDVGIDHVQQKHTLKSLYDSNPYIHSFGTNQSIFTESGFLQDLKITDTQKLYLSMRNVLSKNSVFEGSASYSIIQNFAHFIGIRSQNYSRFKMIYLDKNVKQLQLNANYLKQLNDIVVIRLDADYFNWDVEVYYRPSFSANFSAAINLRDKIKITPSIGYFGKRFAMHSALFELPEQIHVDLGLYYSYSKKISAYCQFNNLTNVKENLWMGYRELGFNTVFGVSLSF